MRTVSSSARWGCSNQQVITLETTTMAATFKAQGFSASLLAPTVEAIAKAKTAPGQSNDFTDLGLQEPWLNGVLWCVSFCPCSEHRSGFFPTNMSNDVLMLSQARFTSIHVEEFILELPFFGLQFKVRWNCRSSLLEVATNNTISSAYRAFTLSKHN